MIAASGAKGMLGAYFDDTRVLKTDLDDLDILDAGAVRAFVHESEPEAFLHLAAATDVDQCELDPEMAQRVNVVGTRNVVAACAEVGCPVVYVSTAQVFSGDRESGYVESDATGPINAYGWTKLEGENVVREAVDKHFIVRTSWLMGGGPGTEKKFVGKLLALMDQRDEVRVVDDKRGCPTYAHDLAETIMQLLQAARHGTYHVCSTGTCTRFEMAVALAELTGKAVEITPVPSTEFPLPAPRPDSEVLLSEQLASVGIAPLRPWRDALTDYLREWGY